MHFNWLLFERLLKLPKFTLYLGTKREISSPLACIVPEIIIYEEGNNINIFIITESHLLM